MKLSPDLADVIRYKSPQSMMDGVKGLARLTLRAVEAIWGPDPQPVIMLEEILGRQKTKGDDIAEQPCHTVLQDRLLYTAESRLMLMLRIPGNSEET